MNNIRVFGLELINQTDFRELIIRFVFNFIFSTALVICLYYKNSRKEQYVFSFMLLNTTIFLIILLLGSVKLKLGLALGLFAIFGIVRYRTNPIPIKEMTYLFTVIGIAVINAMANKKVSYAEIVMANIIILIVAYVFDRFWLTKQLSVKEIKYDNLDLIIPEKYDELKADIEKRTGIAIQKIEISDINFVSNTVKIHIYYRTKK